MAGQASQPRSTVMGKAPRLSEDRSRNRDEKGVRVRVPDFQLGRSGEDKRNSESDSQAVHTPLPAGSAELGPRDAGMTSNFW